MRFKNSVRNSFSSMVSNIVSILVGLVSQALFVKILSKEYLGLNGLFSNIISFLGIVELGVGSAIIYNLYAPIREQKIEEIKSLMQFYKKKYHLIGCVVALLGLSFIPFLHFFIGEVNVDVNIYVIYLMFLADVVASYFLSYKRGLLYASQRNYIINIIHIFYTVILNVLQLLFLYITKNYYVYLLLKIVMRFVENAVISWIVDRQYAYVRSKEIAPLNPVVKKDIGTKVKSLLFHKIGSFFVLGTDNLIISRFFGIVQVGLYSNYYLIIHSLQTLLNQFLLAITPSVGDLLVDKNYKKNYQVFNQLRFINFWMATFTATALLVLIQDFVVIWMGKDFLLGISVVIVLVFNYFQTIMRNSYSVFKEAAGIFYEDRFVPLIESGLNIVLSILLLKVFGLSGVFLGTIFSGLVLWIYSYPKLVYKNLFKRDYKNYFLETVGYVLLFTVILFVTYLASNWFILDNIYLNFLKNMLLALVIPNLILFLLFFRSKVFTSCFQLVRRKRK